MDIASLIGMVIAAIALLGGMHFKGVPYSNLANPAAIFIILVGTTGAVVTAFPMEEVSKFPKLLGVIMKKTKLPTNASVIDTIVELAQLVRKEGLLALEAKITDIEDPFFRRGLELLLTGQNADFIEAVLQEDIDAMSLRHGSNALIFTQAGTYAPTLGVMGAVVGLIAALGNMDDTEKLGHAISGAFMATVYGIYTGYVLWLPYANKLKRKSKQEVLQKTIILTGVLLLEQGLNANFVLENLLSLISPDERKLVKAASKGE